MENQPVLFTFGIKIVRDPELIFFLALRNPFGTSPYSSLVSSSCQTSVGPSSCTTSSFLGPMVSKSRFCGMDNLQMTQSSL